MGNTSEGFDVKTEEYFIESSYSELYKQGIRKEPLGKTRKEMIKTLGPSKGDIILEVGTGEGRFIPLIVEEKATYVGTDISRKMLLYAKDYLTLDNKDYIHFAVAEAKHMPFRPKSVSKSFCLATVFYIPNKKVAINEMKRVTREKMLIEFRNIFLPKIFLRYIEAKLFNFLLGFSRVRRLILAFMHFLPYFRNHLWTKMAAKDPKLTLEPYFPDSPTKILSYFKVPLVIYAISKSKLTKQTTKRWWFKPTVIVVVPL